MGMNLYTIGILDYKALYIFIGYLPVRFSIWEFSIPLAVVGAFTVADAVTLTLNDGVEEICWLMAEWLSLEVDWVTLGLISIPSKETEQARKVELAVEIITSLISTE